MRRFRLSLLILGLLASPAAFAADDAVKEMAVGLAKKSGAPGFPDIAKAILFPKEKIDFGPLKVFLTDELKKQFKESEIETAIHRHETGVIAALRALHQEEEKKKDAKTPEELARILGNLEKNANVLKVDEIIADVGPKGTEAYRLNGFHVYVAAMQVSVNRFELQAELNPPGAAERRLVVDDLNEALDYARREMTVRRLAEVNDRLAKVTPCYTEWNSGSVGMRFEDKKEGWYSQSEASNGDVASARCNGQRDLHEATLVARVLKSIDPAYEKDVEVLDLWAQTLDKLDPLKDGSSRRALFMDFGGTYAYYFNGVWPNSITEAASCPAGYTPYKISGELNVDYDSFICGRLSAGQTPPLYDFGGMTGKFDNWDDKKEYANGITGAASCPASYRFGTLLGSLRSDYPLRWCARDYAPGRRADYLFGGAYSPDSKDKFRNPLTGDMICPAGFTPELVWGSYGARGTNTDRHIWYCWKKAL